MLLTEEQAREKWCCQHDMANQKCYASDCMAWRWEKYYESTPQGCKFVTAEKGYCGLSGEIPK